jgi:hypothetical protein
MKIFLIILIVGCGLFLFWRRLKSARKKTAEEPEKERVFIKEISTWRAIVVPNFFELEKKLGEIERVYPDYEIKFLVPEILLGHTDQYLVILKLKI